MEYILCEFLSGYSGKFYQEVYNYNVIRMTDMDGNTLSFPGPGEDGFSPYCSNVVNVNPPRPAWATAI